MVLNSDDELIYYGSINDEVWFISGIKSEVVNGMKFGAILRLGDETSTCDSRQNCLFTFWSSESRNQFGSLM